jgi:HAD superfamily hydrolase (TIGR01549 family)
LPRHSKAHRSTRTDLPAVLFDLDGTLVDSNYHHVQAWSEALRAHGIIIPRWKIHRRIGMSGNSFLQELLRELGISSHRHDLQRLERRHDARFRTFIRQIEPLPAANRLLAHLAKQQVRMAIATTGNKQQTSHLLRKLKIPRDMAVITGDDVEKAKPSPDIFVTAAQRLHVALGKCIVVGDSVWDLLAAGREKALGVGLLSGGSGPEELQAAGAFRVFADPADLLLHIEQLGLPGSTSLTSF